MPSSTAIPEQGQLVEVRQHRYRVNDLSKSALPRSALLAGDGEAQHLVSLTWVDDDDMDVETELALDHGFHETPQGLRYTLSEPAWREVLARFLELSHARYAEEVAAELHGKGKKAKIEPTEANGQMRLF